MYKHRMNTLMLQLEEVERERDQVRAARGGCAAGLRAPGRGVQQEVLSGAVSLTPPESLVNPSFLLPFPK